MYKTCVKCEENKLLKEFYAQKRRKDGKHPWCKACCKKHQIEHQERRNELERQRWATDPEYRKQRKTIHRNWGRKYAEHKQEYERQRRLSNPEEYKERNVRYVNEHPEMMRLLAKTRARVYQAIKRGILQRACRCEFCRRECKTEAAHCDYSKPLEITWLCRSCHSRWDYWNPKYAGTIKEEGEKECLKLFRTLFQKEEETAQATL